MNRERNDDCGVRGVGYVVRGNWESGFEEPGNQGIGVHRYAAIAVLELGIGVRGILGGVFSLTS